MFRFLLGMVGVELRYTARRAAVTGLLVALGALMLSGAAIAFLTACYILLAVRYDPIVAGFIISGICLILALVFFIIAYVRLRSPRRAAGLGNVAAYAARPATPPPGTSADPAARPPASTSTVIAVAAGAALLGLILGRRI
ncbi:phage holin family protein [Ancylobacter radicis]|uniref:Phage holin family protein n=1 Tax=Ancylobacter radicis TaxID=2836179 RepID=A0ABS5R917_9HYPH|nr:phage holin family protein [Ancylobacter radicis]MBS9477329.1 phage holin family protein [Ancylobacter radicis]